MDNLVFYCTNCKQTFVGEDYQVSDTPQCPKCNKKTQATGFSKELWLQMSKEERKERINALTFEEEKKARRKAYAKSMGVTYEESAESNKESSVNGWYADIGNKIKGWAKTIFIVEAIAFVVFSIIMLFTAENGLVIFAALITAIVGPMIAWVSSWILYAFGELVDKTAANERNTRNILKLMLDNHLTNKTDKCS